MRLTRIITAIAVGLAVIGAPAAAGAAQPFTPQPPVPPTVVPTETVTPQPPPYPPTAPSLTADRLTVPVGVPVLLIGNGWPPNRPVRHDFTLNPAVLRLPAQAPAARGGTGAMVPISNRLPARAQPIPSFTVTADSNGHYTRSVTFSEPGTVLITATSLTTRQSASLTLTVTSGQQPPLPVTGSKIGPQIGVGVAAVLAGALLLWFGFLRRRRSGERSAA
jgi:hypothetical protein